MNTEASIEISGYSIEKKIGEGGMADVYLAKQVTLDRPVALKVMLNHLSEDKDFGVRFLQEAKCIANIDHPNIVPVYEVGTSNDHYFLSMALLKGGDLKGRIAKGIDEASALDITRQIASALGAAHAKGIVHRDIKPQNILFRQDGTPLLTDFGIAKVVGDKDQNLTVTGMMVGSPYYLSPEQAMAQPVDQRSDIYSLGVVLYEMLTQSLPYQADSAVATAMQHVTAPIPLLPSRFSRSQALISRMMAKDPNERFSSVAELIAAIDQGSTTVLTPAQPDEDQRTVIMPSKANHAAAQSTVAPQNHVPPNAHTAQGVTQVATNIVAPAAMPSSNHQEQHAQNSATVVASEHLTPAAPSSSTNTKLIAGLGTAILIAVGVIGYKGFDYEEQQIEELKKETALLEEEVHRIEDTHQSDQKETSVGNHDNALKQELLNMEAAATAKPASESLAKTESSAKASAAEVAVASTSDAAKKQIEANKISDVPKPAQKEKRANPVVARLIKSFSAVPAGNFKMGIKKAGVVDARPVHKVSLRKFHISKYPITNEEYAAFDTEHQYPVGQNRHPATNVSWDDALRYADWLSGQSNYRFRLPTEAEWEYVARAQQTKDFPWGNRIGHNKANCDGCGSQWDALSTSPVGSFSGNSLGVFDMNGNVWEWTEDCYAPNYQNARSTGEAYIFPGCDRRSLRGGAWNTPSKKVHPAYRAAAVASEKLDNVGFRLVRF